MSDKLKAYEHYINSCIRLHCNRDISSLDFDERLELFAAISEKDVPFDVWLEKYLASLAAISEMNTPADMTPDELSEHNESVINEMKVVSKGA